MRHYHVFYIANNEQRIFKTRAYSKKEAFAIFRKSIYGRNEVIDVVDHTAEVRETALGCVIGISVLILITVVFLAVANSWKTPEPVDYVEYTVQAGDSLWGIASRSDMWNKMDAHEIIDDIQEASNCSSTIYPGQIVYIPMYEN